MTHRYQARAKQLHILFALVFFLLAQIASAATITWNTDQSGDWGTASNWSGGVVPGANDDVIINRPAANPTVTISAGVWFARSLNCTDNLTIAGGTLVLTGISQVTGSFMIGGGGLLNVQSLAGSFAAFGPTNINNGRFDISGGAIVNLPNATQYVATFPGYVGSPMTAVSVRDLGSRLELAGVTQLQVGRNSSIPSEQVFEAVDGGVINWSGVITISRPLGGSETSRFRSMTGGQINLSGLQAVTSSTVVFESDQVFITFPSLYSSEARFEFPVASVVSFPALAGMSYASGFAVHAGQIYNFPALTTLVQFDVTVEPGGIVNAPNLVTFVSGMLDLRGSAQFNCGMLINISQARFYISGGNVFNRIAATQYDTTAAGYWIHPTPPIVTVKDYGSRLEMPSVLQLRTGYGSAGATEQLFEARDGGYIDWSGVSSLTTPTAQADDVSQFRASGNAQIQLGTLPRIQALAIHLTALSGGVLDLHSVVELTQGPIQVLADGPSSVVNLNALCTYESAVITESNGGDVIHNGILRSTFTNVGIFGVRALGQAATCSGSSCSTAVLFSLFPDGRCLRSSAIVTRGNAQLDVDGIAVSTLFGLQGFELIHSVTGSITGSRLLNINYDTGVAVNAGSAVLASRVVRAAAYIGDNLFAIDSFANQLLEIAPTTGALVGSAIGLTLNGLPYDIGERADIVIARDNTTVLSDENRLYLLDRSTGALTLVYVDNQPIQGTTLPDYSGLAFLNGATLSQFELFQLNVGLTDRVTKLTQALVRYDIAQTIPGPSNFNAVKGDLGSVSTADTTPPGPVQPVVSPDGDGTTVQMDWTPYSEPQNGNDIDRYVVYKSTVNFSNILQAIPVGQTPAGVKTVQLSNLLRGQQIYLAVVAIDTSNNVNPAVTAVATTPVDIVPPAEVTAVTTQPGNNQVVLSWTGSSSTDIQYYRVYRNNLNVSGNIPAGNTTYTLTGLTPSTGYNVRISSVDQTANESAGVVLTVATLLGNPTGVAATSGASGSISVSWNAMTSANLVSSYRVYAETTNFNSVAGKTVRRSVAGNVTSTSVAGFTNGVTYYVAVTAVNLSGGETQTVSTVQVTPQLDTSGPVLSAPLLRGAPLTPGTVVPGDSLVQVNAVDPSGVNRVDFYVQAGANRTQFGQQVGSGPQFGANWNLSNYPDGAYTLVMEAFDTVGNMSTLSIPVTVTYAPPPAPVITAPASGFTTAQTTIQVQGTAVAGTTAGIFRGGAPVAGPLAVSSAGTFSAMVTLVPGANVLEALTLGRGGISPPSAPVTVTLDQTLPAAPNGAVATALEAGEVRISWSAVGSATPIKYDVYRSNNPFTQISQATKVNASQLTSTSFVDLPATDGTYYYRVVAVNAANVAGLPSAQVSAVSDRVGPTVLSVTYTSTGQVHPTLGTYAPGFVTATVTLSEPLAFAPFFSIAPDGGTPIIVNLVQSTPTQYSGVFQITPETISGTAYALFSGRDQVNNRGTNVLQGQTIQIDTDGPAITSLVTQPAAPIQTTSTTPVTVTFTAELNGVPAPNTTPAISYRLSAPGRQPVSVANLTPVGGNRAIWTGSFTLPADAGTPEPETLSFTLSSVDDLGNAGDQILATNAFQVFQGNLPPLAIPFGLSAIARPAGAVALAWNPVNGAVGYQLFRQAPSTTQLVPLGGVLTTTTFTDQTPVDGDYQYAIASVRQVGSLQSTSSPSIPVSVTADRVPPNSPQTLTLQMVGAGVRADWLEPAGGSTNGELKYALYRANLPPATPLNPTGLTPVINNILGVAALDSAPSESEHAYAVVALDRAGNASAPSNTVYLNFSLLPVSSFTIERTVGQYPELSWSYSGTAAASFRLDVVQGSSAQPLQQGPGLTFVDQGYSSGERRYRLTAFDLNTSPSAARELLLPALDIQFPAPFEINRGIFNRLPMVVSNSGNTPISNAKLRVVVDGHVHYSAPFSIPANGSAAAPVVVGGYEDLSAVEELTATVEITPNPGEVIEITKVASATVTSAALIVDLETEDLTFGATGRMRFSITNTSDVVTEIVTAKANGAQPSDEVQVLLLDTESNVLAVRPLRQFLGGSVITLANGTSVARIQPATTFTSDWISIPVPASAPVNARATVAIEKFHFGLGTPEHAEIAGLGTTRQVVLVEPPYSGQITSITPTSTYDGVITINGQALDTQSNQPSAFQPISLIFQTGGFEIVQPVTTNGNGQFTFEVNPTVFSAGSYVVSAVFPGSLERPNQGSFVINGLSVNYTVANVTLPKNYSANIGLVVSASAGTSATGVAFRYDAADQPNNTLTPGLVVTLPPAVNINPGQSAPLTVQFGGLASAPDQGSFVLGLMTTQTGNTPYKTITVNYTFSAATASVTFTPTTIDTGVQFNNINNQTVVIRNSGLAPLLNAQIQLLKQDLTPAPSWVYSSTALSVERLEIGEDYPVNLFFNPGNSVTEGYYNFVLRVVAPGQPTRTLPIRIAVTQSGQGGLIIHASDIYTGTLGQGGPVLGLEGAHIRLENEALFTTIATDYSDSAGEVYFPAVVPGLYRVRASAPGHTDAMALVTVYPGATTPLEIFLPNNLITVEWSVTEITLEDYYRINLQATFETNVPAAVVVMSPSSINLPTMQQGQILNGELTLTNHGLIGANHLEQTLPASSSMVQIEFFGTIPSVLLPHQSITIPYRITALQNFTPGSGSSASGAGGPCGFTLNYCVRSDFSCANGATFHGSTCSAWFYTRSCGIAGGPGNWWHGSGGSNPPSSGGGGSHAELNCVPGTNCSGEAGSPAM